MSAKAPYAKTYHMAGKVSVAGGVSALCFRVPKPIDLKAALWTLSAKAAACRRCLKVLAGKASA